MNKEFLDIKASLLHDGLVVRLELSQKLFPDRLILLQSLEDVQGLPYLQELFSLSSVNQIMFHQNEIRLRLKDATDWRTLAKEAADLTRQYWSKNKTLIPPTFEQHFSQKLSEKERQELSLIEEIIKAQVLPGLASHGGRCEIVNYAGGVLTLKFSGGCQGCSQITATVKQGIERLLKDKIPSLREIRDVTDHTQGTNPYYH